MKEENVVTETKQEKRWGWEMASRADLCLGEGLKHTEPGSQDGSTAYHVGRNPTMECPKHCTK